jgi:hypothetical protein
MCLTGAASATASQHSATKRLSDSTCMILSLILVEHLFHIKIKVDSKKSLQI